MHRVTSHSSDSSAVFEIASDGPETGLWQAIGEVLRRVVGHTDIIQKRVGNSSSIVAKGRVIQRSPRSPAISGSHMARCQAGH